MPSPKKGLPEGEELVEESRTDPTARKWRRRRWRKGEKDHVTRCSDCGATLNRIDTYYVRPAYTDGDVWLCSGCFDRMTDQANIARDHRYGRRRQE